MSIICTGGKKHAFAFSFSYYALPTPPLKICLLCSWQFMFNLVGKQKKTVVTTRCK